MKKVYLFVSTCAIAISTLFLSGCTATEEQIKVIAQNSGLGATVAWIAYDNPSPEVKMVVKSILEIISEKAHYVEIGKTYMEVIYPEIETIIDSGIIQPQYKPIILAGSLSVLNGIDILFVMYPEWKMKQNKSIEIVKRFIAGANQGLSLAEDDPIIEQTKEMNARRAKIYLE